MWPLLVLLNVLVVHGKETQRDPVIRHIASCPDEGYFFKRETGGNFLLPQCHLCFCHDNGTAMCWQRQNSRCDTKHYIHNKKIRKTRTRRSPGFADMFFRDASRDILSKHAPEQCKPSDSSFSVGCPPDDWCIGCTVCDCNANGRWDCHILSFCPNDKGKKNIKRKGTSFKNAKKKRHLSLAKRSTTTLRSVKIRKVAKKEPINQFKSGNPRSIPMKQENKQTKQVKSTKKTRTQINSRQDNKNRHKSKKTLQINSIVSAKPLQNKTVTSKAKFSAKKDLQKIAKKPVSLHTTKNLKNKAVNSKNTTAIFAKTIMEHVMNSVENILNDTHQTLKKQTNMTRQQRNKKSNKNKYPFNLKNIPPRTRRKLEKIKPDRQFTYDEEKSQTRKKRELFNESTRNNMINEVTTKFVEILSNKSDKSIELATKSSPTEETKYKTLMIYSHTINSNSVVNFNKTTNPITLINHSYIPTVNNESVGTDLIGDNQILSTGVIDTLINSSMTRKNVSNVTVFRSTTSDIKSYPLLENTNKSTCRDIACGEENYLENSLFKLKDYNASSGNHDNIFSQFRTYMNNIFQIIRKTEMKKRRINKHRKIKTRRYSYSKRKILPTPCRQRSDCYLRYINKTIVFIDNDLRAESRKIIKLVQIIKGLLKLLATDQNLSSNFSKSINSSDEIKQLKTILKENTFNKNFSETRRQQIHYVRQNTKELIKSVKNFAHLLNKLIQKSSKKNLKKQHTSLDKPTKYKIKNETTLEKINKVNKILLEYNLIQNKFVKTIYNILNTIKQKESSPSPEAHEAIIKGSVFMNNKPVTEQVDTNHLLEIVNNLKHLEQKLNFKNRRKRYIMEEDYAVDYFLVLIEKLLKNNRRTEVTPVNDGIDLIIEAIRNAPNITVKTSDQRIKNTADIIKTKTAFVEDKTIEKMKILNEADNNSVDNINNDISGTVNDTDVEQFGNETSVVNPTEPNDYNKFEEKILSNQIDDEHQPKYKVFSEDIDDDDLPINSTTTEIYEYAVNSNKSKSKLYFEVTDTENEDFKGNGSKLEWIDESQSFDIELNETTAKFVTTTTTSTLPTTTVKDKYADTMNESQETEDKSGTSESRKDSSNIFDSLNLTHEKYEADTSSGEEKNNALSYN